MSLRVGFLAFSFCAAAFTAFDFTRVFGTAGFLIFCCFFEGFVEDLTLREERADLFFPAFLAVAEVLVFFFFVIISS
jgi:hypothetical protein